MYQIKLKTILHVYGYNEMQNIFSKLNLNIFTFCSYTLPANKYIITGKITLIDDKDIPYIRYI